MPELESMPFAFDCKTTAQKRHGLCYNSRVFLGESERGKYEERDDCGCCRFFWCCRHGHGCAQPAAAGAFVAKMALKTRSKPLAALGLSYKAAAVLAKLLPRRLSNWIVGLIYAK